ncbi:hypothetical protein [Rhizobium tumorigenes]|uniref:hypothetical protein n=1 Tax=Rhizobium tumorigenes TaxID=2041385 RepID=UPI00241D3D07|nr:hypothetical protein [Rhizobium tumorigenes]WFS03051.1 hypothetical protein PR016_16185 [Rhizobium tumorigenes]
MLAAANTVILSAAAEGEAPVVNPSQPATTAVAASFIQEWLVGMAISKLAKYLQEYIASHDLTSVGFVNTINP